MDHSNIAVVAFDHTHVHCGWSGEDEPVFSLDLSQCGGVLSHGHVTDWTAFGAFLGKALAKLESPVTALYLSLPYVDELDFEPLCEQVFRIPCSALRVDLSPRLALLATGHSQGVYLDRMEGAVSITVGGMAGPSMAHCLRVLSHRVVADESNLHEVVREMVEEQAEELRPLLYASLTVGGRVASSEEWASSLEEKLRARTPARVAVTRIDASVGRCMAFVGGAIQSALSNVMDHLFTSRDEYEASDTGHAIVAERSSLPSGESASK